jgi:hypothetical protein
MAEHKNIKNLAESFVATFWNSVFHYHFDNAQKFDVGGKRITGFEDWEKIKNPLDILKGDFRRGSTIKDLLTSICNLRNSRDRDPKSQNNLVKTAVSHVVNGISSNLSAQDLSNLIRNTAEEIVDAALKNVVSESALQ